MTNRKVGDPEAADIGALIEMLAALDDQARGAALAVFAHGLTVELRALLVDASAERLHLGRVRAINEMLHHLTARLHPDGGRSPEGDERLLADIAADAERDGLSASIKRTLVVAMRNAAANARKPVAAL